MMASQITLLEKLALRSVMTKTVTKNDLQLFKIKIKFHKMYLRIGQAVLSYET